MGTALTSVLIYSNSCIMRVGLGQGQMGLVCTCVLGGRNTCVPAPGYWGFWAPLKVYQGSWRPHLCPCGFLSFLLISGYLPTLMFLSQGIWALEILQGNKGHNLIFWSFFLSGTCPYLRTPYFLALRQPGVKGPSEPGVWGSWLLEVEELQTWKAA